MAGTRKKSGTLLQGAATLVRDKEDAPLGDLQARIVSNIFALGPLQSFGYRVLDELMQETGKLTDPAAVYSNIYKLLKPERGVLERAKEQYVRRGPPQKPFHVTAKGLAALEETIAYHEKLAAALRHKLELGRLTHGGNRRADEGRRRAKGA